MKKSELWEKMINIEKEREKKEGREKITLDYVQYLEEQQKLIKIGDIEIPD